MNLPSFAVVGRPNKGKSSIVATLARDDSVYIDRRSGSTRRAQKFPMTVGEETLYVLYDTPGMQRARAMLAWLQEQCGDASSRPATVRRFFETHREDPRYRDECEMLQPILDGAGIIYVVDGSCPYGADYEPEMEILRWTGNPSLALINPIQSESFVDEWRNGLSQYFRTVRVFDAHHAEFLKQLDLLELFGHLDTDWRAPLERAVTALLLERDEQHRAAAGLIADLIATGLCHSESQPVVEGIPQQPVRNLLLDKYKKRLSREEARSRRQVEEVFNYNHLERSEQSLPLEESDLFNLEKWYLWGLSRKSLISVAAAIGAAAGAAVDVATGGLLHGAATLGAAALSGFGAWRYSDDIGDIKVGPIPTGGSRLTIGPSPSINFPFVLLGRALQHHRMLARRTHAHREVLELDSALLEHVGEADRKRLGKLFAQIRKGKNLTQHRAELAEIVYGYAKKADETGSV
jgi:hypothetical protein